MTKQWYQQPANNNGCTSPKLPCTTSGCSGCCFPQQNTNGKCSDGSTPLQHGTNGNSGKTAMSGWCNSQGLVDCNTQGCTTKCCTNLQNTQGKCGDGSYPPQASAATEPSPERDLYGGYPDIDLYNQTPTAYGTLYLLKDFGGNLGAGSFDIDWMTTDLYSYTTVKAPLEQGAPSASPSAVPSVFASLAGVGEFRGAEVATSQVLNDYLEADPHIHPGLIIGASLAYTPGASNAGWEDNGLDETGVLYGIIFLGDNASPAGNLEEWPEPFDWDEYNAYINARGYSPWAVYVTSGGQYEYLEAPYLFYDRTLELPYLSYKFGYGDPQDPQNTYDTSGMASYIKALTDWTIETLAGQIVADEIPNQIINNVIDYGSIKASQLSSFETTEALQSGIESTTYTQDSEGT